MKNQASKRYLQKNEKIFNREMRNNTGNKPLNFEHRQTFNVLIREFRDLVKKPYINSLIIFDKLKEAEHLANLNNDSQISFKKFCEKVFK